MKYLGANRHGIINYAIDGKLVEVIPLSIRKGSPPNRVIAVYKDGDRLFPIFCKESPPNEYKGQIFSVTPYAPYAIYFKRKE